MGADADRDVSERLRDTAATPSLPKKHRHASSDGAVEISRLRTQNSQMKATLERIADAIVELERRQGSAGYVRGLCHATRSVRAAIKQGQTDQRL